MSANAYEELHKRCYDALWAAGKYNGIDVVLAEVFRTLEGVTPEMVRAAFGNFKPDQAGVNAAKDDWLADAAKDDWLAMLRASPLAPSKDAAP